MKSAKFRTAYRSVLWACLITAIAGCSSGPIDSGDKQDAMHTADAIYKAIKDKDFKQAAALFPPQFYRTTTREDWIAHLQSLHDKFGDLKSYKLAKVLTSSNYNGVDITLKYKVFYTKHSAFEQMTFATQPSGGRLQLMNYKVELDRFDEPKNASG